MSKHDAMYEFVKEFPPIKKKQLFFNYVENQDGSTTLATIQSNTPDKDILGNKIGTYDFGVLFSRNISSTTDKVNIKSMDFVDQWIEWIEEQNNDMNFPDFGSNYHIEGVENLNNMGELEQMADDGTGFYRVMCRVNYMKKESS